MVEANLISSDFANNEYLKNLDQTLFNTLTFSNKVHVLFPENPRRTFNEKNKENHHTCCCAANLNQLNKKLNNWFLIYFGFSF